MFHLFHLSASALAFHLSLQEGIICHHEEHAWCSSAVCLKMRVYLVWLMESSSLRCAAHLGLQLLSVGLPITSVIQMLHLPPGYRVHCMLQLLYTTAALHLAQLPSPGEEHYSRQSAIQAIKSLPNANVLSLTLALSLCSLTQICLLDFANRWLLWLEAEAYDLKYKVSGNIRNEMGEHK